MGRGCPGGSPAVRGGALVALGVGSHNVHASKYEHLLLFSNY